MNSPGLLPAARFTKTLDIVWREGQHLAYSWRALSAETIENAGEFAEALQLALHYSLMLMDTYNRVREFAEQRLGIGWYGFTAQAGFPDVTTPSPIDLHLREILSNFPQITLAILAECTGRPVDLFDLTTVTEPLLGRIVRHGRRICGSITQHGNLISRHLLEQEDFMPYRNRILAERRRAWIGK